MNDVDNNARCLWCFIRYGYARKLHEQNMLFALNALETNPPGTVDISNDPHLDSTKLNDDSLDYQ